MRRWSTAVVVLAIVVVAVAVAAGGSAAHPRSPATHPRSQARSQSGAMSARRVTLTPLPALPRLHPLLPGPKVCYVAGGGCSLTPCREFVQRASVPDPAVNVIAAAPHARVRCAPKATTVPIVAVPMQATPAP